MAHTPPLLDPEFEQGLQARKERLRALRETVRQAHLSGRSALQTASLMSRGTDQLLVDLLLGSLAGRSEAECEVLQEGTAMIAIGGTGRGDLAPFSDVDLLFLCDLRDDSLFVRSVKAMVRACWDTGLQLGHRVATASDALEFASQDPVFGTALVEMRLLWGSPRLFDSFRAAFVRRISRGHYRTFYEACVTAREAERLQYGGTERQLEPEVKRSPGGLRDIQLIRWLGLARFGTPDLDLLRRSDALSADDLKILLDAQEFLQKIRTELHFHAGRAQEILTRDEQLRMAELMGFSGTAAQRPVEQFMQQYFRHATAVADVVSRFVERERPRRWRTVLERLVLSRRDNELFRVTAREIFPAPGQLSEVLRDPERLFQWFELAGSYGLRIPAEFTDRIRTACPAFPRPIPAAVARRFLSLLQTEKGLEPLLRQLAANGALTYVLPEFEQIQCLLQFNQYHAFTVDEHTLRTIGEVEQLRSRSTSLGQAAREVKSPALLHLSLLLHDAGKGQVEDHSIVGERLARDVGNRLGLSKTDQETLCFLVRHHLDMTLLAFRRDLQDPALLIQFARQIGNLETLRLLFVHTAADMLAVGPNTFTSWKEDLLTQLYQGTYEALSGGAPGGVGEERRGELRQAWSAVVGEPASSSTPTSAPEDLIDSLPAHYLAHTADAQVLFDLRCVSQLAVAPLQIRAVYDEESRLVEVLVITRDRPGSGVFSRICGTLTARGLSILAANICTTNRQVIIDRFTVRDPDFTSHVPPFRLREIEASLRHVLEEEVSVEELFRRNQRLTAGSATGLLCHEPARVVIDNQVSKSATVIDVFANDARGLLYIIAKALFDLELSVNLAKITTHVDQVLDVFYVTTLDGGKVAESDEARVERGILQAIQQFDLQYGASAGL
ncbi:MAG: [protein-PII] uridylyltransferase [Planctomycetaceae bacterium]